MAGKRKDKAGLESAPQSTGTDDKPISAGKAYFGAILQNEPIVRKEISTNAIATVKDRGRPSTFTDEIGREICDRMALGESLKDITDSPQMPHRGTVYRWANGSFRDSFARAREYQSEALLDDCVHIADNIALSESDKAEGIDINAKIQAAKLQIDTRLRVIAKIAPHKYGDRIQHTGMNGGPIQIAAVTIDARSLAPDQRDALREALLAAKAQQNQQLTIDGTAEEQDD
jgi:hypothetical protein